jgi:opacity protein-like surface antigen
MKRLVWSTLALAAAFLAGTSTTADAQRSGDGYLFKAPSATLSLRGGFAHASAGSDIFDEVTQRLTVDKGDFSGLMLGADLGIRLTSQLDLLLTGAYSRSRTGSEFRDFVDNNKLPIEQTTTFERIPFTAGLKYYVTSRGRSIGSAVWIPARFAPYVGAGVGAMRYQFRQQGDFVNFENNAVFSSDLESDGGTFVGQALVGADYSISPTVAFTAEARYLRAQADLGDSFRGYERIDLSGMAATVGLSFRL